MTLSQLVASIDAERRRGSNLSSAAACSCSTSIASKTHRLS
jgi:predicted DNA-binding ribbon-helix-helix protein